MDLYVEAVTADGWIGLHPGIAQAANIGVFHHRWVPPNSPVALEGDCEGLPNVQGPTPGVCYNMPMGHVPIHAEASAESELLTEATSGEYFKILDRGPGQWVRVDLGVGNIGLDLVGWMEAAHLNINGPCPELEAGN